jgi:predicted AlkP superfamily phosphohydrolase/phosphomutase
MMVEMGIDRIHHGFWRYHDKGHRLFEKGNPWENAIHDYYVHVDKLIGELLNDLAANTSVIVVSDHGAKRMEGAICVNEWLQKQGWLKLKDAPKTQTKFKMGMVDWEHTKAWSEGGYYARMFFNVKGREPQGLVPQSEYEKFRDEVKAALEAITDESGKNIGTKVFKPQEIYKEVKNVAPDLIVHFGNLDWRSAGSVGGGQIYMYENDTGPDDANHAQEAIFIWDVDPKRLIEKKEVISIYDVAPSVLRYLGIEVPPDMIGKSLVK